MGDKWKVGTAPKWDDKISCWTATGGTLTTIVRIGPKGLLTIKFAEFSVGLQVTEVETFQRMCVREYDQMHVSCPLSNLNREYLDEYLLKL